MSADPVALAGPLLAIAMGVVALVAPERVGAAVGLRADGAPGRSELRAVFGGVFVGLGLACLAGAGGAGARVAGAGVFLGGAAAKLLSAALEPRVLPAAGAGLAFDVVVGGLFLWGALR